MSLTLVRNCAVIIISAMTISCNGGGSAGNNNDIIKTSSADENISSQVDSNSRPLKQVHSNSGGIVIGDVRGAVSLDSNVLAGNAPISSIDGSIISTSAVDSHGRVYVATTKGQIFKYSQSTWIPVGDRLDPGYTTVSVSSSDDVYAATSHGDVYKLDNSSWGRVGDRAVDERGVFSVVIDRNNNLYVGTSDGEVFEYNSNGTSWRQLGKYKLDGTTVFILALDGHDKLYAGTLFGNVFSYSTADSSWVRLGHKAVDDTAWIKSIVFDHKDNVYAATNANVYKYSKSAWQQVGSAPFGTLQLNVIAIDSNGNIYAGLDGGCVFKYSNSSWINLNLTARGSVSSLVVDSNDNLYVSSIANSGGSAVFRYDNVRSLWKELGDGALDNTPISAVATDIQGNIYAATNKGGVFKYSDLLWSQLGDDIDAPITSVAADVCNKVYASTNDGDVFKFNGSSWMKLGKKFNDKSRVLALATDIRCNIYASTDTGDVYEYANLSWKRLGGRELGHSIKSLAISTDGDVYAGTDASSILKFSVITNSWSEIATNLDAGTINSIVIDAYNLYAGTEYGHVFRFFQPDKSWTKLGGLVDGGYMINTMIIDPDGNLFVGTAAGNILRYANGDWINTGYGNSSNISALAIKQ